MSKKIFAGFVFAFLMGASNTVSSCGGQNAPCGGLADDDCCSGLNCVPPESPYVRTNTCQPSEESKEEGKRRHEDYEEGKKLKE